MNADWPQPVSPPWPAGVRALTTNRQGPDGRWGPGLGGWNLAAHVGDRQATVTANRTTLRASIGVQRIQWLTQVHGTRCLAADAATTVAAPEADAAWTCEAGLALAVLTADCVPVVLGHRRGTLVAVAHGGWRGLVSGVLERLVAALPAAPEDLVAWLGPAIGPAAYEVGEEVASAVRALPDGDALAGACLRRGRPGRHYLDLFTLSECLLRRAGVPLVSTEALCTFSDRRFFSYRRDGATGRMATLAWRPAQRQRSADRGI